jgi:hypothetical protein
MKRLTIATMALFFSYMLPAQPDTLRIEECLDLASKIDFTADVD